MWMSLSQHTDVHSLSHPTGPSKGEDSEVEVEEEEVTKKKKGKGKKGKKVDEERSQQIMPLGSYVCVNHSPRSVAAMGIVHCL